jgi:hypothetical protein
MKIDRAVSNTTFADDDSLAALFRRVMQEHARRVSDDAHGEGGTDHDRARATPADGSFRI